MDEVFKMCKHTPTSFILVEKPFYPHGDVSREHNSTYSLNFHTEQEKSAKRRCAVVWVASPSSLFVNDFYILSHDSLNYKLIWDDTKCIQRKLISLLLCKQVERRESRDSLQGEVNGKNQFVRRILRRYQMDSMETKYKDRKVVLPTNIEPACYNFDKWQFRDRRYMACWKWGQVQGCFVVFLWNWCFASIHDDAHIVRGIVL